MSSHGQAVDCRSQMITVIGKTLILFGLLLVALGLILTFLPSLRIDRLPGDVLIRKENWSIYLPIATCILLSVTLSLLLWIVTFLRR